MKPKNSIWMVTISPPDSMREILKPIAQCLLRPKGIKKVCLVLEKGRNGNHPHFHCVYEFKDGITQPCLRIRMGLAFKHLQIVLKRPFYASSAVYNCTSLIGNYLTKEADHKILKNIGFDLEQIKNSASKQLLRRKRMRVTIHNYEYIIPEYADRLGKELPPNWESSKFILLPILREMHLTGDYDTKAILRNPKQFGVELSINLFYATGIVEDYAGLLVE